MNGRTTTPKDQTLGAALPRLARMLKRTGLKVDPEPSVPLFRADPKERGVLIRLLNGRETRGRIDVKGVFKPLRVRRASSR